MKKILMTGMTSPHTSEKANDRSLSFCGVVKTVLARAGHSVEMVDPNIRLTAKDLDKYDAIVVGVAPLTSLSANKVYGALHTIGQATKTHADKLTFIVDAPQPAQIVSSLKAITSQPENLVKDFYKNRKDYAAATDPSTFKFLIETAEYLLSSQWPTTLYPALPWNIATSTPVGKLPDNVGRSTLGVNLDSHLIKIDDGSSRDNQKFWIADLTNTKWTKDASANLTYPVCGMREHKGWTDAQVTDRMSKSTGALISSQKDGTWWTYRYAQALSIGIPVVTEWRNSQALGASWSVLASNVEMLNDEERLDLSNEQRKTYLGAIDNKRASTTKLERLLFNKK